MRLKTIVLSLLVSQIGSAWAVIDCSKPKTKVDWMLCSNDKAAREEERMAFAFREAMNRTDKRDALQQEQRDWNVTLTRLAGMPSSATSARAVAWHWCS